MIAHKDWDFAPAESGIIMFAFSLKEFEERIEKFVELLQQEGHSLFITNISGKRGIDDVQEKIHAMRKFVEKQVAKYLKNKKNVVYTDGLQLLNNLCYLSQDLTHPSPEGVAEIVNNWENIIKEALFKQLCVQKHQYNLSLLR